MFTPPDIAGGSGDNVMSVRHKFPTIPSVSILLSVTLLIALSSSCNKEETRRNQSALGLRAAEEHGKAPMALDRNIDPDDDGLDNGYEYNLANNYAPIVYHEKGEEHLPTNVDWFLAKTRLMFYDDRCSGDQKRQLVSGSVGVDQLWDFIQGPKCGSADTVNEAGTLGKDKNRSYYLDDVSDADKKGSRDSTDWVTYYHVYPREAGGVVVQYWRFYAFNDAPTALTDHGGDWEAVSLVFNQLPNVDDTRKPDQVRLTHHDEIIRISQGTGQWNDLKWEGPRGTHPVVYSQTNGHAGDYRGSREGIRQETWDDPAPKVHWAAGTKSRPVGVTHQGPVDTDGGRLVNLGSKRFPLGDGGYDARFLWYSGLWGGRGETAKASGYWGPAYNDTERGGDGFIKAWCEDMKDINKPPRIIQFSGVDTPIKECFPLNIRE